MPKVSRNDQTSADGVLVTIHLAAMMEKRRVKPQLLAIEKIELI